jgi:TRAP-type C4-dicarboxylate transport system permease large subunit
MFLGLATPTEAAALGAITCFLIGFVYGGMKRKTISKCFDGAAKITFMMMMLIVSASAFSELLAYTGAIAGLASLVTQWNLSPIMVVILMQAVMFVMGTALESISASCWFAPPSSFRSFRNWGSILCGLGLSCLSTWRQHQSLHPTGSSFL